MSKFNVGVIGTGHLGSIHTKLWNQNENANLVGIFDTDEKKGENVAEVNKTKYFSSLDNLLNEVEAVVIASPTTTHHNVAKLCIEKGKHCLIEKPITNTHSEGKDLCELANKHNVILQVGHVERFNPALAALDLTNTNPLFIEAHRLAQFKLRATDVSVVHDLMIHDIDIVLYLIDSRVKSIDANGVSVLTDTTDICNARLTFENGAVANLTASRISAKPMRKMRFFQKDSYISCDFGKPDVEVYEILDEDKSPSNDGAIPATMLGSIESGLKNRNIYYEKPKLPELNAIAEEHKAFQAAIQEGNKVPVTAEDATEALRIAEEIFKMIQ